MAQFMLHIMLHMTGNVASLTVGVSMSQRVDQFTTYLNRNSSNGDHEPLYPASDFYSIFNMNNLLCKLHSQFEDTCTGDRDLIVGTDEHLAQNKERTLMSNYRFDLLMQYYPLFNFVNHHFSAAHEDDYKEAWDLPFGDLPLHINDSRIPFRDMVLNRLSQYK